MPQIFFRLEGGTIKHVMTRIPSGRRTVTLTSRRG
jgi:hypothetical protein